MVSGQDPGAMCPQMGIEDGRAGERIKTDSPSVGKSGKKLVDDSAQGGTGDGSGEETDPATGETVTGWRWQRKRRRA